MKCWSGDYTEFDCSKLSPPGDGEVSPMTVEFDLPENLRVTTLTLVSDWHIKRPKAATLKVKYNEEDEWKLVRCSRRHRQSLGLESDPTNVGLKPAHV